MTHTLCHRLPASNICIALNNRNEPPFATLSILGRDIRTLSSINWETTRGGFEGLLIGLLLIQRVSRELPNTPCKRPRGSWLYLVELRIRL